MDDTGFFSVQVISRAVSVWNLELIPFNSTDPRATNARRYLTNQRAFICNFQEHWFTIRRIHQQWFNLNSLLTGPELISDTMLSLFLTQLQQEGYSIYIVAGDLPQCNADDVLKITPAVQSVPPRLINENRKSSSTPGATSNSNVNDDEPLREAMALSMRMNELSNDETGNRENDEELQLALQLSRAMHQDNQAAQIAPQISEEDEMQKAIAMSLEKSKSDDELAQALALSMSQIGPSSPPSNKADVLIENAPKSKITKSLTESPSIKSNIIRDSKKSSSTVISNNSTRGPPSKTPKTTIKNTPTTTWKNPPVPEGQMDGHRLGGSSGNQATSRSTIRQSTPDPDEVRRRRLAFLEKQNKK